ncbi:MAG: hypothetical protein H7Y07_03260 [Pyrinomonadaceae bacterium]|nr:hypothetical protein [Sphingobacteriaceae bacterium]
MKTFNIFGKIYCLICLIILGLMGCEEKVSKPVPPSDYPKSLAAILNSATERNKLTSLGMMIYGGPSGAIPLRAILNVPHKCINDNTIPANINKRYSNYEYTFTITTDTLVSYKAVNSSVSDVSSTSRYVKWVDFSNNTTRITVFFETNGVFDGVSYKSIRILSGSVIPNNPTFALFNIYDCFIMLETGPDPDDKVADVGTIRVFQDK